MVSSNAAASILLPRPADKRAVDKDSLLKKNRPTGPVQLELCTVQCTLSQGVWTWMGTDHALPTGLIDNGRGLFGMAPSLHIETPTPPAGSPSGKLFSAARVNPPACPMAGAMDIG